MKIYLSCDIEGTNGICAWEETDKPKAAYPYFAQKMTREVAAACEGVNLAAPGSVILVKDAHDSARNIDHALLPRNVRLIRGWGEAPGSMMLGVDGGCVGSGGGSGVGGVSDGGSGNIVSPDNGRFDAAFFIGYHSGGGSNGTPLAHTMSYSQIFYVKINGVLASEFLINYYTALYHKVPVVLVTGDAALCRTVRETDPAICTVDAHMGIGGAVIAEHPEETLERIREAAADSLSRRDKVSMALPGIFDTEICFRSHMLATRASWYPGAYKISSNIVGFRTDDYFEFLRYFLFT